MTFTDTAERVQAMESIDPDQNMACVPWPINLGSMKEDNFSNRNGEESIDSMSQLLEAEMPNRTATRLRPPFALEREIK